MAESVAFAPLTACETNGCSALTDRPYCRSCAQDHGQQGQAPRERVARRQRDRKAARAVSAPLSEGVVKHTGKRQASRLDTGWE